MRKRNEEFNIKDLLMLFRPFIWVICIFSLLVSLAFGGYSAFIKKDTYTSSAQFHVIKLSSTQMGTGDFDFVSKVIEDYKVLIYTDIFLDFVLDEVTANSDYKEEWGVTRGYITSHLDIKAVTDDILQISVTTDDAIKSKIIATAVSNIIRNKSYDLFAFGKSLTVKDLNAPTTGSANNKHVVRNSLIGFFGGMIVSMLVIFIASSFDIVIRDKKKLEDTFDIPVIGLIPKYDVGEEVGK